MATCPRGHQSADEEYCEVCGALVAADPARDPLPADGDAAEHCPVCDHPRAANFCEQCGYDFVARTPGGDDATGYTTQRAPQELTDGPAAAAPAWVAVVSADRAYFNRVVAEGGPDAGMVSFPPYSPQRSVPLAGGEVRIGRHSRSHPARPEIDLAEQPKDPGVSHLHAVLRAQPGGGWTLVDPGSANGTLVNGKAVETNVPVPLGSGDRIHLGAWTVITLCERGAGAEGGTP